MEKRKINDIWITAIILLVGIVIVTIIGNIIKSSNKKVTEELYDKPTFYSREEVEKYIQDKYKDDWKIVGEPQIINYKIYSASVWNEEDGRWETDKRDEDAIAYKYKLYRETNNDYIYAYSTSQHKLKTHWSGGFSWFTDKYEKVIVTNYFSDLIDYHKQEINKLATEYGINYEIRESPSYNTKELSFKYDIFLDANSTYELTKVANLIEKIGNVLKPNKDIDETCRIDVKYNYLYKYETCIDLKTDNTYESIYEFLKKFENEAKNTKQNLGK